MGRPDFPRSLAEFRENFATEEACRKYLVACRWPDGFRCTRCGHGAAYAVEARNLLQCRSCRYQVSVTAGTVMHRSRTPLRDGFWAAYLVTTHTPGFSALQLQRQLGLARYETSWTLLHKLRRAMVRPNRDKMAGTVEVDETYIGGVEAGRGGGRRTESTKATVVAAVEVCGRASGRIGFGGIRRPSGGSREHRVHRRLAGLPVAPRLRLRPQTRNPGTAEERAHPPPSSPPRLLAPQDVAAWDAPRRQPKASAPPRRICISVQSSRHADGRVSVATRAYDPAFAHDLPYAGWS
jgi:hypothetical protein